MSLLREHAVELAKKGNHNLAYYMLTQAYENGDIDACNDLGVIAEREGDYETAYECYKIAHENGLGVASRNIGNFYKQGLYVKRDYEKAIEYFTIAAERGYAPAFDDLSIMATEGLGMEKSDEKALQYLLDGMKYEDKREPYLTINAAYHYEKGIGTKVDKKKAFRLTKRAAKSGDACALYNLGLCYLYGKGTEANVGAGMDLLMRAAEMDYPDAFYQLYLAYSEGKVLKPDEELAMCWLHRAVLNHSMRGYLAYADRELSQEKPDMRMVMMVLCAYCLHMESDLDVERLEPFMKKYPDLLDWDEFEKDPKGYMKHNLKGEPNA